MKKDTIHDDIIRLNGEIAQRKDAEQRLADAKSSRGKEDLTPEENETLEECKARLAKRAKADDPEAIIKSMQSTVSNFLRRRKRREPEVLAKSLRNGKRLVLPAKKGIATADLLLKASVAFERGAITGNELNVVDLHHRHGLVLPEALLKKIK